jgi:hypothetical protein
MRESYTTPAREPSRAVKAAPNMLINMSAFLIFTVLWVSFAAALLFNPGILDGVWEGLRGLPWLVQALVWLLLLPVVAGLWIWETDWALWLRLLLVAGLAVANIVAFYPWRSQTEQQP